MANEYECQRGWRASLADRGSPERLRGSWPASGHRPPIEPRLGYRRCHLCAAEPTSPPSSLPAPETTAPSPKTENVAVAGLLQSARSDSEAGKLGSAAATLERALRIEPKNPRLWQELARVRLKQGEYGQAESVAARSNAWAGSDNGLRAENWRLIAQSRDARGDSQGARAALDAADKLGR
jgi:tetratricopeptide (TPR) repeat protein